MTYLVYPQGTGIWGHPREFQSWPEALAFAIENRTPDIVNRAEAEGADDDSWRVQHGLTREQEDDLVEAGLL